MIFLLNIISFFWLVRTLKAVLFWIYLWQLKEYHIERFIDHFRTYKGKKIFLNVLYLVKFLLLTLLLINYAFFNVVFYILLTIYIAESFNFLMRKPKWPTWTVKTILLFLVSLALVFLFLVKAYLLENIIPFTLSLLLFDIFTFAIASFVVLLFQPLFAMARNIILRKAKNKISQHKNLTVIGITGSYGKTSTKEFLATILSSKFKILSTKDHKNSEMGIAKTILEELKTEHQIFIVEMGAYSKGGIKLLCDMARPSIGMVTGVNEQHLSTFGTMENLLSAEGGQELLNSLPKDGLLVVNGDNKYCMDLYKKANIYKKVYSLKNDKVDSDVWAEEISVLEHSLDFMAMTRDKEVTHINVDILGKQSIQNLLGAVLIAKELGMSLEEISKAAAHIKQEQAGITLKKGIHGIKIIDSSYSSNPDGVIADLEYLNVFKEKKVVIMPCLIELGKKSSEVHYHIGKKIAEVCNLAIITTKDKFEEVKKGAVENSMDAKNIIFCEKAKEILHIITTFCKEDDAVLLEGGRPVELIKLISK